MSHERCPTPFAPKAEMLADAREMCLSRLRMVPRDKREAATDAILNLADPEWWQRRTKGTEVLLLILELRKDKVMRIIEDAASL